MNFCRRGTPQHRRKAELQKAARPEPTVRDGTEARDCFFAVASMGFLRGLSFVVAFQSSSFVDKGDRVVQMTTQQRKRRSKCLVEWRSLTAR